ncbi:MAG TPA: cyclodeaminase/cyclohydrolase family protein [bacterium]|nr:cyclodeaminase/cyclohydrolase family protein [bacterium]
MKLTELTLEKFLCELGSASPTPGGGSVAALAGALAAALCRMVSVLTVEKESLKDSWREMEKVGQESARLEGRLRELVDQDTQAFRKVMDARKLPKATEPERQVRSRAIQEAALASASVPLETLETLRELSILALSAADKGNPACVTDAGSASQMIKAGAISAAYNVRVNLPSVGSSVAREELRARTAKVLQEVMDESQRTENIVDARLQLLHAGA